MKEKEQKIFDASLKLFVEKGFHGTSTAKIAEIAEVSTGTLFNYFKTKEELINRLYFYSKESMFKEVNYDYDDKKTIKENFKTLWLNLVYFCTHNPNKFRFIITFHYSPFITSLTHKQMENQTESMLELFRIGTEQQEIKELPIELVVGYLWGNMTSTINYFTQFPQKNNKENRDMVFELFWDGIQKR